MTVKRLLKESISIITLLFVRKFTNSS